MIKVQTSEREIKEIDETKMYIKKVVTREADTLALMGIRFYIGETKDENFFGITEEYSIDEAVKDAILRSYPETKVYEEIQYYLV